MLQPNNGSSSSLAPNGKGHLDRGQAKGRMGTYTIEKAGVGTGGRLTNESCVSTEKNTIQKA